MIFHVTFFFGARSHRWVATTFVIQRVVDRGTVGVLNTLRVAGNYNRNFGRRSFTLPFLPGQVARVTNVGETTGGVKGVNGTGGLFFIQIRWAGMRD